MWVLNSNQYVILVVDILFIVNMMSLFVTVSCCLTFTTVDRIDFSKAINVPKEIYHSN